MLSFLRMCDSRPTSIIFPFRPTFTFSFFDPRTFHTQFAGAPSEPAQSREALLAKSADGQYALKRLTRGVCSSRDFARPGFSSALASLIGVLLEGDEAELLQKKRDAVFSLVLECTVVPGIHDQNFGGAFHTPCLHPPPPQHTLHDAFTNTAPRCPVMNIFHSSELF